MYDYEILSYLEDKYFKLSNKEYMYICSTCPQINHIKYNSFEDKFEIWTDCNYFKFDVYLEED